MRSLLPAQGSCWNPAHDGRNAGQTEDDDRHTCQPRQQMWRLAGYGLHLAFLSVRSVCITIITTAIRKGSRQANLAACDSRIVSNAHWQRIHDDERGLFADTQYSFRRLQDRARRATVCRSTDHDVQLRVVVDRVTSVSPRRRTPSGRVPLRSRRELPPVDFLPTRRDDGLRALRSVQETPRRPWAQAAT